MRRSARIPTAIEHEPDQRLQDPGAEEDAEVDDGSCDPFYFYWNHDKRRMDWWRN